MVNFKFFLAVAQLGMVLGPWGLQRSVAVERPPALQEVGVQEKLGETPDFSKFEVTDETGRSRPLSDYFGEVPVVLQLVYFGCPMMCGFVFEGDKKLIRESNFELGRQYRVLSISIDPKENHLLATEKKANLTDGLVPGRGAPGSVQAGWSFLTASREVSEGLGRELGIGFKYEKAEKQYAHPAVSVVLSPRGKVSRYLYGFEHRAQDVRLALLEASQGKIGTVVDQVLLFCYRYDPHSRGYSLAALRTVQLGSFATVLALGGFYFGFWRKERARRRAGRRSKGVGQT